MSHGCSVLVSYLQAGLLKYINYFPAEYIVVVSVRVRIRQRMRQFVVKKHPFDRLSLSVGCVLSSVLSLTLQLVRCRVTERERQRKISRAVLFLPVYMGRARQTSDSSSIAGSIEIH